MARLIPYDVTGVEESGGGTGVKAPPAVYVAKITVCEKRTTRADGSPANDLRLAYNVGDEFDWVFDYIGLGASSDWKLAEFVRALGLKDKGNIDPDKVKGKLIRVKLNADSYDNQYTPRAGRLMKAQPGDEDLFGKVSELSSQTNGDEPDVPDADADTPEAEATEGFVPSRETDPDIGTYDDWGDDDLLAEVEDRGLTMPGGRGAKRDKAIKALRADDESATEPDENQDGVEAAAEEAGGDDYDTWDLDRLKTEWNDRDMGDLPNIRGRNAETRVKNAIIEALREDDEANPFEA